MPYKVVFWSQMVVFIIFAGLSSFFASILFSGTPTPAPNTAPATTTRTPTIAETLWAKSAQQNMSGHEEVTEVKETGVLTFSTGTMVAKVTPPLVPTGRCSIDRIIMEGYNVPLLLHGHSKVQGTQPWQQDSKYQ